MIKIIIKGLILGSIIATSTYAGGKGERIDRNKLSDKYDTNHYKVYSNYCKEIYLSGLIEIKNKNLDYDKNKVFFKHQRITYVLPDKQNERIKNCIRERSTGINEINMKKMLLKID